MGKHPSHASANVMLVLPAMAATFKPFKSAGLATFESSRTNTDSSNAA